MVIRASSIRLLAKTLVKVAPNLSCIPQMVWPEAFKWEPVDEKLIALKPYAEFLGGGMGVEVYYDGLLAGVWRPGSDPGEEFYCQALATCFRFAIDAETHLLRIEKCRE